MRPTGSRGFALVLCLLVVALLTVTLLEADFQARANLRAAAYFRDDLASFYLAQAGVNHAMSVLKEDVTHSREHDGLDESWASTVSDAPLGEGTFTHTITDEEGKINLNNLVRENTPNPIKVEQLKRLFEHMDIDPNLVNPIIDWMDTNDDPQVMTPLGAESAVYGQRDPPYSAKNGLLSMLSEIRLVAGITDEIYKRIRPYVTIYGDPPQIDPEGKINVNTADKPVLISLDKKMDEAIAGDLIAGRPFKHVAETQGILPTDVYQRITPLITQHSRFFSIKATGTVRGVTKVVHAVVKREAGTVKMVHFEVE